MGREASLLMRSHVDSGSNAVPCGSGGLEEVRGVLQGAVGGPARAGGQRQAVGGQGRRNSQVGQERGERRRLDVCMRCWCCRGRLWSRESPIINITTR